MRLVEHVVLPLFKTGAVRVPVADTFALDELESAYQRFEGAGRLGKLVLEPQRLDVGWPCLAGSGDINRKGPPALPTRDGSTR